MSTGSRKDDSGKELLEVLMASNSNKQKIAEYKRVSAIFDHFREKAKLPRQMRQPKLLYISNPTNSNHHEVEMIATLVDGGIKV